MSVIKRLPKQLFFLLIVKPVVYLLLGLNIYNKQRLPSHGPAILAANHNSHLDTLVLMALYPLGELHRVRPVAAADYFLRNRFTTWLSLNLIGIIPLDRQGQVDKEQVFEQCQQALADGQILLLFPEGSRGEAEELQPLRKGIYHLARSHAGTQGRLDDRAVQRRRSYRRGAQRRAGMRALHGSAAGLTGKPAGCLHYPARRALGGLKA